MFHFRTIQKPVNLTPPLFFWEIFWDRIVAVQNHKNCSNVQESSALWRLGTSLGSQTTQSNHHINQLVRPPLPDHQSRFPTTLFFIFNVLVHFFPKQLCCQGFSILA